MAKRTVIPTKSEIVACKIAKAWPLMTEYQKDYIMGTAEACIESEDTKKEKDEVMA